jgi:parvulin-like peptidyl-prolyl isomerase
MAKRKQRVEEDARELTRKEVRVRARDRVRNRRLYWGAGIAIGFALLVIIVGLVKTFVLDPNSVLASVGDDKIITQQFWKRTKLEQSQMENQLVRLQDLEKQFGGKGFFTQQVNQLQSTLSSPFALGMQVLNNMIDEKIVAQQAKARGITVSDEEVDKAIREEIAAGVGAVTESQATATAVAGVTATAEAKVTAEASPAITTTAAATTPVTNSLSITTSKPVTTSTKVTTTTAVNPSKTVTGTKTVTNTKAVTATTAATPSKSVTTTKVVTPTHTLTATKATTGTTAVTSTNALTVTPIVPPTPTAEPVATRAILTDTAYKDGLTKLEENLQKVAGMSLVEYREVKRSQLLTNKLSKAIGEEKVPPVEEEVHARHILVRVITPTPAPAAGAQPTETPTPLPAGAPPPTPTPAPRTQDQAIALAKQLRDRIVKGEKFEDIAAKYSEDTGSGQKGGDLGWFGRGAMVKEFENAAFSVKPGDISQPITTTFGVHLIQVLEKDPKHKLDEQTLSQKRTQAYQAWLQEQLNATKIQRPEDLTSKLPRDLPQPALPSQ